jgi:hypothetical protein
MTDDQKFLQEVRAQCATNNTCGHQEEILRLLKMLEEERAKNLRLQRRLEDCGHWKAAEGQRLLDRSLSEERQARKELYGE